MPKSFIAVLDHHHLENSIFLTAFAKSLAKLGDRKGIVIHGDSPYTDRLIQTGMMREDARLRAIKDLNKRLIGLFADNGVATVGVHGFQKSLVTKNGDTINIDETKISDFHAAPNLLISNLVDDQDKTLFVSLPEFTKAMGSQIQDAEVILFSKNEKDEILISNGEKKLEWSKLSENFRKETLPEEFQDFNFPAKITTATDLGNWPDLKKVTIIE